MNTEQFTDVLTPVRIKILRMLREEKHPEEIAEKLSITRQGVDKHLSILYLYGMVDKRIKMGRRPMVFYRITSEGEDFFQNFEELVENHILAIKNRYKEELLTLDRMLVDGKITENEYLRARKDMEKRFSWVIENEDKEG
ncbi:putative transcriptional regulator [Aciduliprofundum sp. MAR08-339]|uniref:ArsR/SmtB family transcription factor n=1 Tax=Aciduliprofundum sp. (strain MAR08-339) TaxID=673860 RepID=UPI0002A4B7D0|nr:putative transcriptional regulator [Aciduliprofundum sp. MAR08-339]